MSTTPAATSEHDLISTRTLPALPDDVYRAFADPSRLAQWWGPAGFTNTVRALELRPGGAFRIVMRGPDGAEYDNHSVVVDVQPGRCVVFDHVEPVHAFRMAMHFAPVHVEPLRTGTQLTWHMRFAAPLAAAMHAFLLAANEQNFDRLQAHLTGRQR